MIDLRAQWTEEAVGANDPQKADVINRLVLVEHNIDGTHNFPAAEIVVIPAINLTGGQLAFPAAQNASADPNTLDDYEEGTWSPVLVPGAGSITAQNVIGTPTYVKIGRLITVVCQCNITNIGTASGTLGLSGLPFATAHSFVASGRETWGVGNVLACTVALSTPTVGNIRTVDNTSPAWANNRSFEFTFVYLAA